jgi:hypothetical protein
MFKAKTFNSDGGQSKRFCSTTLRIIGRCKIAFAVILREVSFILTIKTKFG